MHRKCKHRSAWVATPRCIPPSLNQLTSDGPHTGAWQHVSVKHTQLQLVFCLFKLLDHLVDKLEVALAVADECIKHLWGACVPHMWKISKFREL